VFGRTRLGPLSIPGETDAGKTMVLGEKRKGKDTTPENGSITSEGGRGAKRRDRIKQRNKTGTLPHGARRGKRWWKSKGEKGPSTRN